jgi:hypothetical protein
LAIPVERRSSAAAQLRRLVDEVLNCARSAHANTTVSGGAKPHITVTKVVADYNDPFFRAMLSGIEYAAHGHFDHGRESAGHTEWILKTRLVDVTVRAVKGLG